MIRRDSSHKRRKWRSGRTRNQWNGTLSSLFLMCLSNPISIRLTGYSPHEQSRRLIVPQGKAQPPNYRLQQEKQPTLTLFIAFYSVLPKHTKLAHCVLATRIRGRIYLVSRSSFPCCCNVKLFSISTNFGSFLQAVYYSIQYSLLGSY